MAEKLKALVEKGNLINLNIVSDSLANLLNEVATMLVDQQRQIVQMRKDINEKMEKEDFLSFKDQWRADRDVMMRSLPNVDSTIQRMSREIESKNAMMKSVVEDSMNSVLMTVDSRIAQKMDAYGAEQMLLHQTVSALENKLKNVSAGPVQIQTREAPKQPAASQSNEKYDQELATLSRKLQRMEEQIDNIAKAQKQQSQSQVAVDKASLDALRAEMKQQLLELQSTIPARKQAPLPPVQPVQPQVQLQVQTVVEQQPYTPIPAQPVQIQTQEHDSVFSVESRGLPPLEPQPEPLIETIPEQSVEQVQQPIQYVQDVQQVQQQIQSVQDIQQIQQQIQQMQQQMHQMQQQQRQSDEMMIRNQLLSANPNYMMSMNGVVPSMVDETAAAQYAAQQMMPQVVNRGFDPGIGPIEENELDQDELEEIRQGLGQLEEMLEEQNKSLVARIERKCETSLVERMFEKLRVIIASVRDDIGALQKKIERFVVRTDMEEYVQGCIGTLVDDEQAALSNKPLRCLACGRTRMKTSHAEVHSHVQIKAELPALNKSPKK